LKKAILWAIGIGNYNYAEIYEEGNKKLKEWGCSTRKYDESKRSFMNSRNCHKRRERINRVYKTWKKLLLLAFKMGRNCIC